MMTFSARLTLATAATSSSIVKKRWMIPRPPQRAIAIAILASVTVSMLAETIGQRSLRFFETLPVASTCLREVTEERLGTSRTSWKVKPSRMFIGANYSKIALWKN